MNDTNEKTHITPMLRKAHRALQQTLRDLGQPVTIDGVLGPQTLGAIALVDAECLRLGLQAHMAKLRHDILGLPHF
jgi:lysozyme family protein